MQEERSAHRSIFLFFEKTGYFHFFLNYPFHNPRKLVKKDLNGNPLKTKRILP